MPQFAPGASKAAIVPITVKPSGLSCQVEIFLGPDELTKVATSGGIPFTSTGASQKVRLPITMPTQEGSFHPYIDVYAGGNLIAAYMAVEDVVITALPPTIVDATWEVNEISGTLGGILVKGTISISSPRAFSGKISIAIPGKVIASNDMLTPEQHQALIDYYEDKRAACTTETCRHHYDIVLESRQGDPMTGGFYDTGIDGRETSQDIEEHHIGSIGGGVASKSYPFMAPMYFNLPAGASQVTLGFFMKADEAHYRVSDGARLYCIGYKGGTFSPEVKLYEGPTLVEDVIYTDAINFGQWWTGNECTLPWGAYPISADVPATVKSGGEFWASHTVYLTFVPEYQYRVGLYVPISTREWTLTYALLQCAPYPGKRPSCYIRWLSGTGEVTFRGIPECNSGEVPAEAVYGEWDDSVPPGTYRVRSKCWKGRPSYTYEKIWDIDTGITITVI